MKSKIFILLFFIYLFFNLVIPDKILGDVEISQSNFLIDAAAVNTKINYLIDDTITSPKLTISLVSGEVEKLEDILKVSDDKTTVTFADYTLISIGNKVTSFNGLFLITTGCLLVSSLGGFKRDNGIFNILFITSLFIILVGVSSITLSEVTVTVDIKVPSSFKFDSLTLILGTGSTNINGLIGNSLNVYGCDNIEIDHSVTISQISVLNLNICSTKSVDITSLQLTSTTSMINITSTTSNVNINFYNGYNGELNVNSNTLNVVGGGCTLNQQVGTISNGVCGTAGNSKLTINAVNGITTLSNVVQSCLTGSWRPTPASSDSPLSPSITKTQSAMESKFDETNLTFMAQSGYSTTSLTNSGSNEFTINYIINAPASNWLVGKTLPPSFKANTDYQFSISLKLGQPLGKYNIISNMTLSFYNPSEIQDPNGTNQYFKYSPRNPIYAQTFQTSEFTSSTSFVTKNVAFRPTVDIGMSTFALQINRTTKTGPEVSTFIISDMKLIVPSKTITTPTLLTKDSELVVIPKPSPPLDPQDSTSCPYNDVDLVHWHDVNTWSSGSVPLPSTEIIVPAGKRVLISPCSISQTEIYKKITIPPTSELIFADSNITLNIESLYVQGKFTMGTNKCRYNAYINIVFHGLKTTDDKIAQFFGSKGIAVASGGFISVHGKQYHNTWTKLSASIWSGDITINVQDNVNWEIGQSVLITTSIYQDELINQNEVLIIAAIKGKQIQFTTPVKFYHHGGQEYQAEVALLSRRIIFKSDDLPSTDSDAFGGHVLINGEGQFAGIQLDRMGQKNFKARYPLHYHLAGNVSNSYISDCSVVNSFYRCYTLHGTNNVTLTRNVGFNVFGHCFYLEDGVEVENTISFNLAAYVHTIYKPAQGNDQTGEDFVQNELLTQPADTAAGGFYITNAWNSFIGNAASGGWSGYSFVNLDKPIGNHRDINIVPSQFPVKVFEGNTAHSSGYYFPNGASIYVGGSLTYNEVDGLLYYDSGRFARNSFTNGISATGNEVWMRFNNTKIYLSNRGLSHWGSRVEVVNYESHDSRRSVSIFGDAWLSDAIINGQSSNILSNNVEFDKQGFQTYDTNVQTILSNIVFRNFVHNPYAYENDQDDYPENDNKVIIGMTHSDVFKPQGITAFVNVTVQNTDSSQLIGHRIIETGSSRYFNFVDYDGSIFSRKKPTIVGSHDRWWQYDSTCTINPDWQCWICDKGDKEIATLAFVIPDLIDTDKTWPATAIVGNISLFDNGITDKRSTVVTRNPGVTGVSNIGWYFYIPQGSPTYFKIWVAQVVYSKYVLFAIPYPAGTTFSISCDLKGSKLYNFNYTLASSSLQVKNGNGKTYYFDGKHLFVKIVNHALTGSLTESFNRGGAKVYNVIKYYFIHITATNTITPPTSTVNGFYTNLPDILPIVV